MRAGRVRELRAEMNVMTKIVHAQLQIFQSKFRRVTAQVGRFDLLGERPSLKMGMRGMVGGLLSSTAAALGEPCWCEIASQWGSASSLWIQREQESAPAFNFLSSQAADIPTYSRA